jgi:hypothetical protein
MNRRTFLTIVVAGSALGQAARAIAQAGGRALPWTQWGGPFRNFQTEARGLKDTWPAAGPPVGW